MSFGYLLAAPNIDCLHPALLKASSRPSSSVIRRQRMAHIAFFSVLLMLWLAGRASADGGDDFANNLASDLGPIIALFGERVVMQFMSQAMGITDCILLAVAPIGAITTVVSAIRVAGPAWLKSFIGRARENLSAAEIEVMSSTSKEACELWNGHSVVRCPGSADIYQFICLLPIGYDLEALSKTQAHIRCEKLQDIAGEKDDDLLRKIETSGPRYAWRSFDKFLEPISTRANDIYQRRASYHTSVLLHLNLWKRRERTLVSSRSSDLEAASHQDQSSISTQMEIDMPESQKPAFRTGRIRPIPRRRSDKTDSSKRDLDGVPKDSDKGEEDKKIVVVVDRSDESAPNLLLNCHDRVQRGEIYLAAAFGVILQLGALVYFGFITYDPPIKGQFFLKDGKRIVDYAFPCAAGGTVLLVLGLFICAWVVEKSTTETCYEAPNHQMFVVWLQKDHTVNDQVFKPYAVYPTSRRKTTEGWEQMKLENGTISSLARKLEKIGFGTLSDIYFDLIMPLSLEQKLTNVKNVLDEAIEQAQQHERSRQWKKLVSTCSSLLDLAQLFNPDKEASGPLAVAACMEFLFRLRHEADLQRQEGRSEEELITQLELLEEKFTSMEGELGGSAVYSGIKNTLAESSGGYATTFDMLIGTTPEAIRTFPESFNISNEHQELVQTNNSGGTLYWTIEELEKVDSFGWSPLHYAANWQLQNLRMAFSEKGGLLNLRDLMGRTPLHHACLIGNEVAVDLLLDHDAPIETAGNDGITAVHCAVLGGNVHILEKLVEKVKSGRQKHTRKSILHVDRNERHPIHWAATKGDLGIVSPLKDDINRTDRFGWTCAHLAVIYENARLLQDIIEEFAIDLNLGDNRSRTPLHLAVENKSLPAAAAHVDVKDGSTPLHQSSITRLLIEKGADIDATGIDGRTALFIAAANGVTAIAALLIESGADIAIAANDKRTPLHMAVQHEDIVRLLLAQDANVGAADVQGRTPLYLAAADGAADVAALLIVRGADVKTAAKDGRTALHVAVNHKDIAEMLLGRGADINAVDVEGQTPLYLAATDGTAEVAALLMDNGAHVATAAGDGRTALHMALSRGEDGLEIAKKLLGFDPGDKRENPYANAVAHDGATPLHIAAEYGPPEAVEMLLHLGANIDQMEGYRQTALLIAMYREQWGVVNLLLDAGANIKADDRVGYTPLLGAVMGDQEHIVKRLLSAGADTGAVDEDGYSSIHLAIDQSGINTLSLLLAAGANMNAVGKKNNQTPLHFAVRRGNGEMVQTLLEHGADTDRLNHLDFSPLQYAVYLGDLEIVKRFVRHDKRSGATTRKAALQRGKDGDTPMHTLCQLTQFTGVERTMCEMLKELLSVAPESDTINVTNEGGLTPLDTAYYMQDKYPEFVGMLKEQGAKLG
ncbi:ankyrin repeat-containing domain protein [Trichoderma novae-zelandiae]